MTHSHLHSLPSVGASQPADGPAAACRATSSRQGEAGGGHEAGPAFATARTGAKARSVSVKRGFGHDEAAAIRARRQRAVNDSEDAFCQAVGLAFILAAVILVIAFARLASVVGAAAIG